jgi:hypothetical protein
MPHPLNDGMIENWNNVLKTSIEVFSIHDGFTRLPRRLISWLYQELLKNITMPKLVIGCQGQWRAGLTDHIFYQCDAKKTQRSNIPVQPS